jgi:hypothetical protein
LSPKAVVTSFLSHYGKVFARRRSGVLGLRQAVRDYAEVLFPGIAKGKRVFGALERSRARLMTTVAEFFSLRPLEQVRLEKTPVLCLYARKDPILEIYDGGIPAKYQKDMRRLCPRVLFHAVDTDHFFSIPTARGEAVRSIASFLDGPVTKWAHQCLIDKPWCSPEKAKKGSLKRNQALQFRRLSSHHPSPFV